MMKIKIYILFFLCLLLGGGTRVLGENKGDNTNYRKLFSGKKVVTREGLMVVHQVNGKVLAEFPLNLLEKDMMFTSAIQSISDNGEGVVGQFSGNSAVFTFTRMDSVIQARVRIPMLPGMKNTSGDVTVDRMLEQSKKPGVYKTFRIMAYTPDKTAVVIDLTSLFLEHSAYTTPFPAYAGNSYYGLVYRDHRVQPDRTMLKGIKANRNNIVVTAEQGYNVDHLFFGSMPIKKDWKVSVVSDKILMLLPEESMSTRKADSRVGIGAVQQSTFAGDRKKLTTDYLAKRWRVEPADVESYRKGELVEPKKPIVFYLDSVMPQAWVKYIRAGVEEWNKAFSRIGFKNVLRVKDFRDGGADFDATNINYSTIRYSPQWMSSLQSAVYVDPRSGEILNASIYLHHNIVADFTRDRVVNTMVSDPDIRKRELSDEKLGEAIKMAVAREVGLCLGLVYNIGASSTFPVDSLRSARFTREYGLSSSVMDFVTCNYIAQPEDVKAGVRLISPGLGVYDYCLIKWLYQPVYGSDEAGTLDQWVKEFRENPYCRFRRGPSWFEYDPALAYYDLGDDPIKALAYRMKNMKSAIRNLYEWYKEEDKDYSFRRSLAGSIQFAFTSQGVKDVLRFIGGLQVDEVFADENKPNYIPVPKAKQKEALQCIVGVMKDLSWLDNREVLPSMEVRNLEEENARNSIVNMLFARMPQLALCASYSDDPYTPEEYIHDLYGMIWEKTQKNQPLTEVDMKLQMLFLGKLMSSSTVSAGAAILEPVRQQGVAAAPEQGMNFTEETRNALLYCQNTGGMCVDPEFIGGFGSQPNALAKTYPTAHLYLQMLMETEQLVKNRVVGSSGKTKLHYEYLLYKIRKSQTGN